MIKILLALLLSIIPISSYGQSPKTSNCLPLEDGKKVLDKQGHKLIFTGIDKFQDVIVHTSIFINENSGLWGLFLITDKNICQVSSSDKGYMLFTPLDKNQKIK